MSTIPHKPKQIYTLLLSPAKWFTIYCFEAGVLLIRALQKELLSTIDLAAVEKFGNGTKLEGFAFPV